MDKRRRSVGVHNIHERAGIGICADFLLVSQLEVSFRIVVAFDHINFSKRGVQSADLCAFVQESVAGWLSDEHQGAAVGS
jgi:hypothetical protein